MISEKKKKNTKSSANKFYFPQERKIKFPTFENFSCKLILLFAQIFHLFFIGLNLNFFQIRRQNK